MTRWIAFLRAINLGGHTVKMDELRRNFSAAALNIAFLAAPLEEPAVVKLQALTSEIDNFHTHQGEIFWLCRKKQSQSTFSNAVLEKTLGLRSTMRSSNTIRKLAKKYSQKDKMTDHSLQLVLLFNDALNARDLEALMALQTEDCIFENTYPAPDGTRYAGQAAVRSFWEDFFHSSAESRFEVEEIFALGERVVMRWAYHWQDEHGVEGHIRGVDLYSLRVGRIAEKLSYVKG